MRLTGGPAPRGRTTTRRHQAVSCSLEPRPEQRDKAALHRVSLRTIGGKKQTSWARRTYHTTREAATTQTRARSLPGLTLGRRTDNAHNSSPHQSVTTSDPDLCQSGSSTEPWRHWHPAPQPGGTRRSRTVTQQAAHWAMAGRVLPTRPTPTARLLGTPRIRGPQDLVGLVAPMMLPKQRTFGYAAGSTTTVGDVGPSRDERKNER